MHKKNKFASPALPVVASLALVLITIPHVREDFRYGELVRRGVPEFASALALAVAYALTIAGILLALRRSRMGYILLALTGSFWSMGAAVVHVGELLASGPYRHGAISKLLEVGIILFGLVSGWLALACIAAQRRDGAGGSR